MSECDLNVTQLCALHPAGRLLDRGCPPAGEGTGVGVINAAAVALGLLTEAGPPRT